MFDQVCTIKCFFFGIVLIYVNLYVKKNDDVLKCDWMWCIYTQCWSIGEGLFTPWVGRVLSPLLLPDTHVLGSYNDQRDMELVMSSIKYYSITMVGIVAPHYGLRMIKHRCLCLLSCKKRSHLGTLIGIIINQLSCTSSWLRMDEGPPLLIKMTPSIYRSNPDECLVDFYVSKWFLLFIPQRWDFVVLYGCTRGLIKIMVALLYA
jgi:hypothetical protein